MPNKFHKQDKLSKKIFGSTDCISFAELLAYSEDKLSPQDRYRLEKHLVDCDFCYKVLGGLKQTGRQDELKHISKEINANIAKQFSNQPHRNWRKYAAAASVLLALAVGSILYTISQPSGSEQLFAEFFEPFPNIVPLIRKLEQQDLLKQAMQAYELKNYQMAAEILQSLVAAEHTNMTAHFYLGVTLLSLDDDTQVAINYFQQVIVEGNNKFVDYAQWYLALGYLKQDEPARTKRILEKLMTDNTDYIERGEQLLRALDR